MIPNEFVYSGLFNACANAPVMHKGFALKKAVSLLEDMAIKGMKANQALFNSMIKAFAFCGDTKTALLLADKLTQMEKMDAKGYSHVLMAIAGDKEAGFWFAVQVGL